MYILYSLLLAVALVLTLPWWALQLVRMGKYRAGLSERLGFLPPRLRPSVKAGCIWVHAVSVGEVLAVSRLVTELQAANPQTGIFISTTTATGQKMARERFSPEHVFFAPLDLAFAVRSYVSVLRPSLLVLAETEFWPNLLRLAHGNGAAVAIVNARISDRSFPRYRKFRWFFSRVLAEVDLFLAQTAEDATRLKAIGAHESRIHVSGNLKFDVRDAAASPLVEELQRSIPQGAGVIVCGSTTEGEEQVLVRAFAQILLEHPSAVMVLAPRHPERFDAVARLIEQNGVTVARRSQWKAANNLEAAVAGGTSAAMASTEGPQLQGTIFLLDSIGELASVYALADMAFVGGSLLPGVGGHNILEPAQHGVPVLTGPHTRNFREIVRIFETGGGLITVTEDNLREQLLRLLRDPERRRQAGQRAVELFLSHSGATARTLAALESLLRQRAAGAS